jgi:hypothetical protein
MTMQDRVRFTVRSKCWLDSDADVIMIANRSFRDPKLACGHASSALPGVIHIIGSDHSARVVWEDET